MPMAVWQIDHTLVDVIIVSEADRVPIGRPWLTLIVDVASRLVAGFYISLDPPSALSVARALSMAVARKDPLFAKHDLRGNWPIQGKPRALHSDNAAEFVKPSELPSPSRMGSRHEVRKGAGGRTSVSRPDPNACSWRKADSRTGRRIRPNSTRH